MANWNNGSHVSGQDSREVIDAAIRLPLTMTTDDGRICDVLRWTVDVPMGQVTATAELVIRRQSHQDQPGRERDE
jgi:hypothetical protein